jgi:hypothetical protein
VAKGFTGVPHAVARILARLDCLFGSRAAASVFLGELKQVRRYLGEAELKTEGDMRMTAAAAGARVAIGQSLGSVVVEFLGQHPAFEFPRLITIGSRSV